jgi:hypothetical protein
MRHAIEMSVSACGMSGDSRGQVQIRSSRQMQKEKIVHKDFLRVTNDIA